MQKAYLSLKRKGENHGNWHRRRRVGMLASSQVFQEFVLSKAGSSQFLSDMNVGVWVTWIMTIIRILQRDEMARHRRQRKNSIPEE